MKITKLEYQKTDPHRVSVYVDEKFIAGLDVNDLVRLGLYNGQEISQGQLNKIIAESEFGKLFNSSLNFLSYRPRSEWEIRRKLKVKSPPLKIVEQVINKLKEIGQINDEQFVKWYLDQRNTFKPMGKRGLKYELLKKGVDHKLIDTVLRETTETDIGISEETLAQQVLEKRFKTLPSAKNPQEKIKLREKMWQFLASRGFDYETIKEVVAKRLGKEYNNDID